MVLMQELGPLLTPPDKKPLEHTGLQRFRQYFDAMAHALSACQAEEPASGAACIDKPVADGFDWTCLTLPAANVLMLVARLTQQLPVTACCEVSAYFIKTHTCVLYILQHTYRLEIVGTDLCWTTPHQQQPSCCRLLAHLCSPCLPPSSSSIFPSKPPTPLSSLPFLPLQPSPVQHPPNHPPSANFQASMFHHPCSTFHLRLQRNICNDRMPNWLITSSF